VKVAAYQSPLATLQCDDALRLIREQIDRCESLGVEMLCCAEGVLGGLADYVEDPAAIAIDIERGQLNETVAALASDIVTTILGFTETVDDGRLYNSAAIIHRGSVVGIYRKLHPAINRSVYAPGTKTPVFTVDSLTFGILLCRDSTFAEPAAAMVAQGATALFVPTNNGMPASKGGTALVAEARTNDIALAKRHGVPVIRADVAGRAGDLVSFGSTSIMDRTGAVLACPRPLEAALIIADLP